MVRTIFIAVATLWCSTISLAQEYPSRPITFVVPTPPGGAIDTVARAMGEEMSKRLGGHVVIDNRSGASGMLGTQVVARAAPDGYTVLVTNSTPILTVPYIFAKVPYTVQKDLDFVTQIAGGQLVLAVGRDVPAKTMKEFLAWATQNKGKVNYGSIGTGTSGHLVSAYLNQSLGLDMVHVPYRGETPMIQDLLGGQLSWGFGTLGALAPHLQSGRLRALAVIAERRVKELPDTPTMSEAGLTDPEYKPLGWIVMMVPAGTPAPIRDRLEKEAREVIQTTVMKARFQTLGLDPIGSSSLQFRKDYATLAPVVERMVRISGAKAE